MSTHSYSQGCFFCGAEDTAHICEDNKPPSIDYTCLECGMYSIVKWERLTLDELNMERKDLMELEPLKERKELLNDY